MTRPRLSPLDCVSSYNTKGMSNAGRSRISKFNFFANQVIRKD